MKIYPWFGKSAEKRLYIKRVKFVLSKRKNGEQLSRSKYILSGISLGWIILKLKILKNKKENVVLNKICESLGNGRL